MHLATGWAQSVRENDVRKAFVKQAIELLQAARLRGESPAVAKLAALAGCHPNKLHRSADFRAAHDADSRIRKLLAEPDQAGRGSETIAREIGVSVARVVRIRKELGLRPDGRERKLSAEKTKRLDRLLLDPVWSKRSIQWIADAAGVSWITVKRQIKRLGLKTPAKQKRDRIVALLSDPVWQRRSTKWIASELNVDPFSVARIRCEMGLDFSSVAGRRGVLPVRSGRIP